MTWQQGGSRQARGYGAAWQRVRAVALRRDLHVCQPCARRGDITPANEVDHIIPKAHGGTDNVENLQAICRACHNTKTQAEAAAAQGRTMRRRAWFDREGRPVWPE